MRWSTWTSLSLVSHQSREQCLHSGRTKRSSVLPNVFRTLRESPTSTSVGSCLRPRTKTWRHGLLVSVKSSLARRLLSRTPASAKGMSSSQTVLTHAHHRRSFGFVMYYSPAAAENCIRGFFHLGFQASYAQVSSGLITSLPLLIIVEISQRSTQGS